MGVIYLIGWMHTPPSLERLVQQFGSLPGIGGKTARRLAYHVLGLETQAVMELATAMTEAKQRVHTCSVCRSYTETDPCPLCTSSRRDRTRICVVEKPQDIIPFESSGAYQGLYFVLHGVLSPLDGIGPEALHLPQLVQRVRQEGISELIVALGSSPEADSTSLLLDRLLHDCPVQRTRLARGIPMGSDLEFVDELTMIRAFEGRIAL